MPSQKPTWWRNGLFEPTVPVCCPPLWESHSSESLGSWSHHILSQELRDTAACLHACLCSVPSHPSSMVWNPCLGNGATHGGLSLITVDILSQGMPTVQPNVDNFSLSPSSQAALGYVKSTKLTLQPQRTSRLGVLNIVPWNPRSPTEGYGTQGGSILAWEAFLP